MKNTNPESMACKTSNCGMHIAIIALLVVNTAFSVLAFVKKDALWLETLRVGGQENFNKIVEVYKNSTYVQQQSDAIDQFVQTMGTDTAAVDTTTPTVDTTDTTTTPTTDTANPGNANVQAVIDDIKENGFIKGNKDARFTIVEYSDLECPFCKKHHQAGTIAQVLAAYPDDVNVTFKHFPLSFHPNAQKAAEAVECVGQLEGNDEFFKYIDKVFSLSGLSITSLVTAAKDLGFDDAKISSCINDGTYAAVVQANMVEGSSVFGVNGTPGNVIIDNESGKYVVIAGAYPFSEFDTKLKEMMK